MARRSQDTFGRRARQEGFAARSVYKLREIDKRTQLLRPGQRVLDLGASPGSWTQHAAQRVGKKGRVVSVDLKALEGSFPPHVVVKQADIYEVSHSWLEEHAPFDVVLSDMAPRTSGQRHADQFRSYELFMRALEIALELLAPGGHFVGKIFQGAEFEDARAAMKGRFGKVRIIRPESTRSESYETFLVGLGRK